MIITAKFLGPTNTKGARIKVSSEGFKAKYHEWDCAHNPKDNYELAIKAFMESRGLKLYTVTVHDLPNGVLAVTNTSWVIHGRLP